MSSTINPSDCKLVVGILIFNNVEILDVAGPFEVFSVTRINEHLRFEEDSPFKVMLIAENPNQILTVGGLHLTPDFTIDNCPKLDLLMVPGGMGTRTEVNNSTLIKWISNQNGKTKLIASVCTGSSLLGRAGLLDGHDATTHWRSFDFLLESAPKAHILKNVLFTLEEPVFTSAGVAAGIDLALYIVSYFWGVDVGQATARHMEYPYPKTNLIKRDT
ncbi:MAG TPA: DJ-1/PfpI family protein [Candidatus Nitrosocosmicus sp.]